MSILKSSFIAWVVFCFSITTAANNVTIFTKVPLKSVPSDAIQRTMHFIDVTYDLTWSNSWRKGSNAVGSIQDVLIRNGGSAYTDGDYDIVFTGGGATTQGEARVRVVNGSIASILSFTPGVGYTESPTGFTGISTTGNTAVLDVHVAPWWDAVWVFGKYRKVGTNTWKHMYLSVNGHTTGSGTPTTFTLGRVDESTSYHAVSNPNVGLFVYRSQVGSGETSITNGTLRWDIENEGLQIDEQVEIVLYGIEMVYVPQGAFYVGTGISNTGELYTHPNTSQPYKIASADAILVSAQNGSLYYTSNFGDQSGPIPAGFPNGFNAFYVMKYELTQWQYVDFLNSISALAQEALRGSCGSSTPRIEQAQGTYFCPSCINDVGMFRCGIRIKTSGNMQAETPAVFETLFPHIPIDGLNYFHLTAYMDWSGLRPFSELEYEKACRGSSYPIGNEYAWGTSSINSTVYQLSGAGTSNESISSGYANNGLGNAAHHSTAGSGIGKIEGPVRTGIFAVNASDRVKSGGSFYGVMELTGNINEIVIGIGSEEARKFRSIHGDGNLEGNASNVAAWPGADPNENFKQRHNTSNLIIFRKGGSYGQSLGAVNFVSYREALNTGNSAGSNGGGRGARSAPAE